MAERTPLGSFGQLPLELRRRIYMKCVKLGILHLLQASSTIYSEYFESIQSRRVFGLLRFHIDPSKHPATIDISTQYGRPCGSIDATSPHLHADTNPIRTMPIGRYRILKLKIDAPDPEDFGQTIRLCKQVSAFVTSLSPCWFPSTTSAIPSKESDCPFPLQMKISPPLASHLCISFEGIERGRWGRIARWWDTGWIYHWPEHGNRHYSQAVTWTDYENSVFAYVLRLLQQLRGIPTCLGTTSRPDADYRILYLNANINVLSSIEDHFGLNWGRRCAISTEYGTGFRCKQITFDFDDYAILRRIHALQAQYELLLDDAPGRSVNLLRQERFLNWCGAYEHRHNRALWEICSSPMMKFDSAKKPIHPTTLTYGTVGSPCIAVVDEKSDDDLWDEIDSSFHSRFWGDLSDPAGVTECIVSKAEEDRNRNVKLVQRSV